MIAALLVALAVQLQTPDSIAASAGALEPRPAAADTSPLQARVDAAVPGALVEVGPGIYRGDLTIDRSVRLVGRGRPVLEGSGTGSVVRIRAPAVTIEGFDIDGRDGGRLEADSAGIHISAAGAAIRDCRIRRSLFGIYLLAANAAHVEGCVIEGMRGKDPGEQGSGVHVFNTTGFSLVRNDVRYSRDGFYLQSSSGGRIVGNVATDVRYGLHYMYSDDNLFEDNLFRRSDAGAAVMYSRRIQFRRNRFLENRGFASVGLLLQACEDIVAEDNLIADNARGVFLEGSIRNTFRRNAIVRSDTAIVLYDSSRQVRFEDNVFSANLSPLMLVGRRTDAVFTGNYWSDHDEPDLDGDGVRDRPYRLSNVFDHIRSNLTAADLLAQGLGASVLGAAERMFPVLEPVAVVDARPLASRPALPAVPLPPRRAGVRSVLGLVIALSCLCGGLAVLVRGGASGSGWHGRRPDR
jgi:nitrous oxidase accessory protein